MIKTKDQEQALEALDIAEKALANFTDIAAQYTDLSAQEELIYFVRREVVGTYNWLMKQQTAE